MQTIKDLGKYTFKALLENSVSKFKERPALKFPTSEGYTYESFDKKISEVQALLASMDIKPGDKVAIYAKSQPNWGVTYFAIVTMGAIAVPLLPDFNAEEVKACLEHSETKTVFVAEAGEKNLPENLDNIIKLEDFSVISRQSENAIDLTRSYKYDSNEDDTSTIIYTSGTTGRSKGVELSHKNLVSTALACKDFFRVNKYHVALSILPMSHVYELTVGFILIILNGASVVYLEGPPVPRILMPTLKRVRPHIMLVVPIVIEKIYKNKVLPAFNKSDFTKKLTKTKLGLKLMSLVAARSIKKAMGGRLKFFGIGGAKVDPDIEKFLKRGKFPYAIGYGLTETSPLIAGSNPKHTKPGLIGPIVGTVQVKLINQTNEGVGELVVKGPNVMKGYYKDPKLTAETFTDDGWFKTGDLCSIDSKGRLAICGRSKNMILSSSGENIYPEDIEFVLNQHPIVSESLVVEGENSSLVAIITLNEEKLKKLDAESSGNSKLSNVTERINLRHEHILDEVKFFVNKRVNKSAKINQVKIVPEFEKTASQKIKRYLYSFIKRDKDKK